MAERESTTKVETTAKVGLRASSVPGNIRRELADVISSPELTRRVSPSRPHVMSEDNVKEKIAKTRSSGKTSLQKQRKNQQQSGSQRLTTSRKLQCIDDDDDDDNDDDYHHEHDTETETENNYADDPKTLAPTGRAVSHTVWSEKTTNTSCISENDSLLERLREKEKQFDEKITTLDETLWCAERGRKERDSIIENLRAEISRLRSQLDLASAAKSQTDELRERILKERTVALEEARAKIEELNDIICKKDIRIQRLEMEKEREVKLQSTKNLSYRPEVAETVATLSVGRSGRQQKQQQQQQQQRQKSSKIPIGIGQDNHVKDKREKEREHHERYAATLRAMQDEVNALERSHNVTRKDREALAEENHALRCKLEAIQDGMESRVAEAMKVMRNNIDNKRELEAEVVATRLSMARLLRLLSEVPEMRRFLRVNDIDGEMIFIGYSAATIASKSSTTRSPSAAKNINNDDDMHKRRHISLFPGVLGTGVDDGIYGGNTQLQSCNVYLNGQWCKQLQEIIDDENYFLRRSKIHIGELEETSRGGRGENNLRIPSPCDVLQGRQHEKDFWIPHAIFVEAQKFKNRYFSSLSHECFYPFFININKIWNEKMKYRVAAETRRRIQEQQQQQKQKQKHNRCLKNERENDYLSFGDSPRLLSSSASALWRQLQTLRGEVRRRVTGKNSLELFNLYDQLARCTLQHLKDVQTEHATLLEQHQYRHRLERARAEIGVVDEYDKIDSRNERENGNNIDTGKTIAILRQALTSLAEEVQDISERASSRVTTSCRDLQQFLSALRDQQLRVDSSDHQHSQHHELTRDENLGISQTRTSEYVPALTLFRIIDGVLGFVEEVEKETLAARNSLFRCTARVDEKKELLLSDSDIDNDSDIGVDDDDDDDDSDDSEDYNKVSQRGAEEHEDGLLLRREW
ncbi:uncharacterized protein TM35_000011650 [Trypanosoma theileri]|uniref:Uncharacterized protein n=1 Tax=Trypanosoma theileri TaxID=67003 RepID=A0A1X0P8T8_9TRYP|nr:uncharacterized protein TM35_000011650 [Trypanosoma theileri]ORC93288.1 hypothetical protein TM35_000011650 [Trypanosoma theileri]